LVWLAGNTRLDGSVAFQFLQLPVIKPVVFRATRVRFEENETKKVDEWMGGSAEIMTILGCVVRMI
jgi:hypothetical protein